MTKEAKMDDMEDELAVKTQAVEELSRELEEIRACFGSEGIHQLQDFEAALKQRDGIITQLTSNLQQARDEKEDIMREFLQMTEQSHKLHIQFQQLQAGETLRNTTHSSTAADLLQARQQMVQYQQQLEDLGAQVRSRKEHLLGVSDLEIIDLESYKKELENSKLELQTELKSSRDESQDSKSALEKGTRELESCKEELAASRQKERTSSGEVMQLMGTVEDLQRRCHQGSLSEGDVVQRMEEESLRKLERLRAELDEMYGQQIVQMKQELQLQHAAAVERLSRQHGAELDALRAQEERRRLDVDERDAKLADLQETLQESQAAHGRAQDELHGLAQEKLGLQAQVEDLLRDLRQAKDVADKASHNLTLSKGSRQTELQHLQRISDGLRCQLEAAEEAALEVEAKHESEVTNYKIKLEMLEREKDAVLDRMAQSQEAELERLRTQLLFSHEEELILLREDLRRESFLNTENLLNEASVRRERALEELRATYEEKLGSLGKETAVFATERAELLEQILALKGDLKAAQSSSRAEELVQQLQELQAEVVELRQGAEQRGKVEREYKALLTQVETLENEAREQEDGWRSKLEEKESEKQMLNEYNTVLKKEIDLATETVQSLTLESNQKVQELAELRDEIEKQRTTYSFAERNFEVNFQELKGEYTCLIQAKTQLEERTLKVTLEFEAKIASLQSQVRELKEGEEEEESGGRVKRGGRGDRATAPMEKDTTELMEKLNAISNEKESLIARLSDVTDKLSFSEGKLERLKGELLEIHQEHGKVLALNKSLAAGLERERDAVTDAKKEGEPRRPHWVALYEVCLINKFALPCRQPKNAEVTFVSPSTPPPSSRRNLLREHNYRLHQVLQDVLKTTAAAEETMGLHVESLRLASAADSPPPPPPSNAGLRSEASLGRLHTKPFSLCSAGKSLEHARVTQTELMRESFRHNQEVGELLQRQEELQERLAEEARAREQLALELHRAEGKARWRGRVTASRLNELEQERLLMHQEKELLGRQQDAMRETAGPRELHLLEETEKLMKEKVEVQRQAEKDSSDLGKQVKQLEAELEEQVNRSIELEQAQRNESRDLRQQIQSLEKQMENNRKFLDEQAVDREHERDVFQQEIQKLEEQLRNPQKLQGASDPRGKEVERLSSQLQEKADWCSELLLGSEQRQRELDDRDQEIDKLEGRVRELEQALLASAESLGKVSDEERKQHDAASEARHNTLEAQLQTEREALDRKEKEISHLEEQLEQFREELENKSEEAQQLQMQLEIQEKELGSQQEHLETRESMLQVQTPPPPHRTTESTDVPTLEKQILVLNEKLSKRQHTEPDLDQREDLIRDLESQVECLRSEQERLKRNGEVELEQLNAVIDKLQQELANIEQKLPPHHDEEEEEMDTQARVRGGDLVAATSDELGQTQLEVQLADSKQSCSQLQQELEYNKQSSSELQQQQDDSKQNSSQLEKQLEELKQSSSQLQQELDDSRKNSSQLENKLADYKQSSSQLQQELADSKRNSSQLEVQLEEYKQSSSELEVQLADSKQNSSQLQKELENNKQSSSELQQQQDDSRQNSSQLEEQIAEYKQSSIRLQQELDDSKQNTSQLQGQLEDTKQSLSKLQEQVDQYKQSSSQLQQELDTSKQNSSQLEKQLADYKQSSSQLQQELDTSKQSCSQLEKQLADYKQSSSQLKQELEASKQNSSQLEEQLEDQKQSSRQLQQELEASKQNRSQFEKRLADYKQSSSQLQQELDTSKQSCSQLEELLEDQKQSSSQLQKQLDDNKQSSSQIQEELNDSNRSYSKLQEQLEVITCNHLIDLIYNFFLIIHFLYFHIHINGFKEEEEEEVVVAEVIGEFQEKIVQMQELHAAEILDMEARHIAESEGLRLDTLALENECKALKAVVDKLRSGEVRGGEGSYVSNTYNHSYSLKGLNRPYLSDSNRTCVYVCVCLFVRLCVSIQTLLREVHQEGMQVLSLSEFPLTEDQAGGSGGPGWGQTPSPGWPRERQALLDTVQSLKTLVTQMQTSRGTQVRPPYHLDLEGRADWRGELLGAVQQVLMGERGVLKSALYSQLDQLDSSDAIVHLNQLEQRLAQQVSRAAAMGSLQTADRSSLLSEVQQLRATMEHLSITLCPPGVQPALSPGPEAEGGAQRGSVGPGSGAPGDRVLLEELKGELSQTKLELETTLKAQHKHLKELDALRSDPETHTHPHTHTLLHHHVTHTHTLTQSLSYNYSAELCYALDGPPLRPQDLRVSAEEQRSRAAQLASSLEEERHASSQRSLQAQQAQLALQSRLQELQVRLDTQQATAREMSSALGRERRLRTGAGGEEVEGVGGERSVLKRLQRDLDEKHAQVRKLNHCDFDVPLVQHQSLAPMAGSSLGSSSSNFLSERLLRQNAELTGFVSRLTEEKSDLRNQTLRLEDELRRHRHTGTRGAPTRSDWAVSSALLSQEREAWSRERSRLEKALQQAQAQAQAQTGRLRGEVRSEALSDVTGPDRDNAALKRIYGKYLRSESFRKALVYQKKYLLLLLGGFQECEEATLALITRMGGRPAICGPDSVALRRRRGLTRFRSAVRVSIALSRYHVGGDGGSLTCSHLLNYDPDRALTDYISRLEALQRRLGSSSSYAPLHFGLRR
uniref:Pericentrin/AKAP-450 centrosomal targeting domain-containing protein n=1 Tax=Gadus morhua TaxID=8049 RepID=A0A8C5APF0_GADMO